MDEGSMTLYVYDMIRYDMICGLDWKMRSVAAQDAKFKKEKAPK